jgi:hypothetical protein
MSPAKKSSRRTKPRRIYQIHVALDDVRPVIWRRLWVADTLTLAQLDLIVQAAMGWTNSHLHEFEIEGQRYGIPDDQWPGDNPLIDDQRSHLGTVLGDGVTGFAYVYDFGDNWRHTVTIERCLAPDEFNTWPICLAGQNACPPEDVGGVGGYLEFLKVIRDPLHQEHIVMWRWYGGPFDPGGFDVNAANAALGALGIEAPR